LTVSKFAHKTINGVRFLNRRIRLFGFFAANLFFAGPSIAEEPSPFVPTGLEQASDFNIRLDVLKTQMRDKFQAAQMLANKGASEEQYLQVLEEIREVKRHIAQWEETWRKSSIQDAEGGEDSYALWDIGETTISQLVMEYGASDYLYIIPPELG